MESNYNNMNATLQNEPHSPMAILKIYVIYRYYMILYDLYKCECNVVFIYIIVIKRHKFF